MKEFIILLGGLIAFGTLGFWLLFAIETVFIIGCIEHKSSGWGIVWGIATLFLLVPLFKLVPSWHWLVIGFFGYFLIGGIWSLIKWYQHARREVIEFNKSHANDLTKGSQYDRWMDKKPNETQTQLEARIQENRRELHEGAVRDFRRDLNPSRNKDILSLWICFWPWSILWTCTRDLVNTIFDVLSTTYVRITEAALKKLTP